MLCSSNCFFCLLKPSVCCLIFSFWKLALEIAMFLLNTMIRKSAELACISFFVDSIHGLSYQKNMSPVRSHSESPSLQQGYFGSVLYTGDFRLHSQHAEICTLQMLRDKELSRTVLVG